MTYSLFFRRGRLTYNFATGSETILDDLWSETLIGAMRLGAKTWTLGMLHFAAITKFQEYETELGVEMLICCGIHTDLLPAWCISTDRREIIIGTVTYKNT